eukprot:5550760-Heterocapsa_arctica.AAC.1
MAVPAHLKDHVSTVLFDLVSAQRDPNVLDSGLVLLPGDDTHGHKLKVCEFMAAHGLAKLVHEECNRTMSAWALTSDGMAQLQLANVLINPRKVTEPRPNVKLEDLTIIELHTMLTDKGWRCRVWSREYADQVHKARRSKVASD